MLRVFTTFSGYDSQCLALDRLGIEYELVGWSEIDKNAIQAHNALYPQWKDRNYGDITKICWHEVPDFDLLTYSSPCQDFSQAGAQAGGEKGSGTRSSLLWYIEEAIAVKKPRYLLMENVAALVSAKFVGTFNRWQALIEMYGYQNYAEVLNAKNYGVPQNRERVFLVSVLADVSHRYYFPKPFKLERRLKDVLEQNVPERYYINDAKLQGVLASTMKEQAKAEPTDNYLIDNDIDGGGVRVIGNLQPENTWNGVIRQQNRVIDSQGLSPALTAEHYKHEFKIKE